MPRRVNLPGADELFRGPAPDAEPAKPAAAPRVRKPKAAAQPSGRVRHDEKITVYFSTEELVALEQARLQIRADYGLNVDRGRLVREAVAMLVADLAAQHGASTIVQRLQQ